MANACGSGTTKDGLRSVAMSLAAGVLVLAVLAALPTVALADSGEPSELELTLVANVGQQGHEAAQSLPVGADGKLTATGDAQSLTTTLFAAAAAMALVAMALARVAKNAEERDAGTSREPLALASVRARARRDPDGGR